MRLDLIYLAFNRREFTEFTFQKLIENTNWELVNKVSVYDDGSTDGAREYLASAIRDVPVPAALIDTDFRSPVKTMLHYLEDAKSDFFAKVDNDLVVPPGWLEAMISVCDKEPRMQALGMECSFMGPPAADWDGTYTFTPWRHIGGNGLIKTDVFKGRVMDADGYQGWTGFQWRHDLYRGWVTPDLPVCLLDRCPREPWLSLCEYYRKMRWQRPWRSMPEHHHYYWDWFAGSEVAA